MSRGRKPYNELEIYHRKLRWQGTSINVNIPAPVLRRWMLKETDSILIYDLEEALLVVPMRYLVDGKLPKPLKALKDACSTSQT